MQEISAWGSQLRVAQWREGDCWHIPDSFRREFPTIAQRILAFHDFGNEDRVVWVPHASGRFSITSCYETMRHRKPKVKWNNVVWSGKSFPRHSFLMWLVVRGRIKTKMLLRRRGVILETGCCLCMVEEENYKHLFFECYFTKAVWERVLNSLQVSRQARIWPAEWRWIQRKGRGRSMKAKKLVAAAAATIYNVWEERNRRTFTNTVRTCDNICNQIVNFMKLKFEM